MVTQNLSSPPSPPTAARPPAAVAVPAIVADACPSCGGAMPGEWCAACGERRVHPEHLSLRHFLGELRDDVLGVDGRVFVSFRLLVTRPGFLTLEALQGRRKPYLGAFKMYLMVFAALLLLTPLVGTPQTSTLAAQFTRLIHAIAVRRGITDADATKAFTAAALQHEGWIAALIPLMFAAMLFAAFRTRRRWFGEHLLFATHFATFNYLFAIVLVPVNLAVHGLGAPAEVGLVGVSWLVMVIYTTAAIGRVYGTGKRASLGWGVLLILGFGLAQLAVALTAFGTAAARLLYF